MQDGGGGVCASLGGGDAGWRGMWGLGRDAGPEGGRDSGLGVMCRAWGCVYRVLGTGHEGMVAGQVGDAGPRMVHLDEAMRVSLCLSHSCPEF